MVPLEYQVRLQAKPPVNQQGKQTNREREGKPARGSERDRKERSINQKSKSELATFSDIER